jgi:hypothetical protein
MAQISKTLYNTIAQDYAAIQVALSTVQADARAALDAIVDVDTLDYPGDPSDLVDPDAALEIELALLGTFNIAYTSAGNLVASTSSLIAAVKAVNDHVIVNETIAGTSTVKLNTWINTRMQGYWSPGSACPAGWEQFSSDANYDTSTWVTE